MQNISQKRNIGPQVSSKNTDKTIMTQLSDKDHQAQMEDMKSFDGIPKKTFFFGRSPCVYLYKPNVRPTL